MEFSLEKLKELLAQSKGLHLLPEDQRQAFIDYVLKAPLTKQDKVFQTLLESKKKVQQAESEYKTKVTKALDEYISSVQRLQKDTLTKMRTKAEKKNRNKEEGKMNQLLGSLDNL